MLLHVCIAVSQHKGFAELSLPLSLSRFLLLGERVGKRKRGQFSKLQAAKRMEENNDAGDY